VSYSFVGSQSNKYNGVCVRAYVFDNSMVTYDLKPIYARAAVTYMYSLLATVGFVAGMLQCGNSSTAAQLDGCTLQKVHGHFNPELWLSQLHV